MIAAIRRFSLDEVGNLRALVPLATWAMAGLLGFTWLCDCVGENDGATQLDRPIAEWFAQARTAAEGAAGLFVAKATSPVVLILLLGVAVVVLWRRGIRREPTVLGATVLLAWAAGTTTKLLEHRARPATPINLAPQSEPSFPSGHVLVVATIALLAVGLARSRLHRLGRMLAVLGGAGAVLVVSLDRLLVGAHWLTDVAGSLCLASVFAGLALIAN